MVIKYKKNTTAQHTKQIKLIIIIKNLGRLIIATTYKIKLFFQKHIVALYTI